MKIIFALLIFTSIFSNASFDLEGGISGGGGCVINPMPPPYKQDPEAIKIIIQKSRFMLREFLENKYDQLDDGELFGKEKELFSRLFSSEGVNIRQVLLKVDLNIENDTSCFTDKGAPVDGSVYSNKSGTVCISAKNIADKVHISQVPAQSMGLVLHEYSEIMGFNEEESIFLQKIAIKEIREIF